MWFNTHPLHNIALDQCEFCRRWFCTCPACGGAQSTPVACGNCEQVRAEYFRMLEATECQER